MEAERFRRLYDGNADALLRYAVRRTDAAHDAADVVAETFLTAWRRLDTVPAGSDARLWLYGVARRVLANQRRGLRRRSRLVKRLSDELALPAPGPPVGDELHAALTRLRVADRELLYLAAWEGLQPAEIAVVLRISPDAARTRLHRARARLRDELGATRPTLTEEPVR